jgi:hypothetical protein
MDRAYVLQYDVSIRVEELLIIGAVETIAIAADGIQFPQLEAYASVRAAAGLPSYVEELEGPGSHLFPSPHANPGCKIGGFDFQSATMPLRVCLEYRTEVTAPIGQIGSATGTKTYEDCTSQFRIARNARGYTMPSRRSSCFPASKSCTRA